MLTSMRNLVAAVAIVGIPPGWRALFALKPTRTKPFSQRDLALTTLVGAIRSVPCRRVSICQSLLCSHNRHALQRVGELSAAIQAADVCESNSITVRPCRVRMNAIKQISKKPSQPAHSSAPRPARTAPHHHLHECRLLTGMRPTEDRLAAIAHDIAFRSAAPSRQRRES